jgi:integrase
MEKKELSTLMKTFLYSIKSKETQKIYQISIGYFEQWHEKKIEDLLKLEPKVTEEIFIQYIIHMRERNLSYASITSRLAPIATFLTLNDVIVNKKKLKRFMGEDNRTIKDEAYTHEDLSKMFQHASFRTKLLIAIYSSTGIRKGAIIDLKLKHLEKLPNSKLYKFTIYENTKEEYITFCTPECASLIDQYIEKRQGAGEKITQDSYLIRNEFDFVYSRNRIVKKTSIETLNIVMNKLLFECELRKVNHPTEFSEKNNNYQRHSKAIFHAFRKYFNTCLVNCDVNVTIKEMLMGHSVRLDDAYYRPNEKQLLAEYSKAINELTINEENRLKKKVTELESKQSEIDLMKYQHQMEMKQITERIEILTQQTDSMNKIIEPMVKQQRKSKLTSIRRKRY